MESHKCVFQCVIIFSLNISLIHIFWNRVVDIQQCHCILADNRSNVLAESAVNINLAGNRNTLGRETAVYITWNKSKLGLECGPAFSCDSHILAVSLVSLYPVL